MTIIMNQLTNIQNELLKNMTEEETSEAVRWLRNRGDSIYQSETNTVHSLTHQQKQTFTEMIETISQQNFLENDRLGWLLTRVLYEYYSKISGFDIQSWLDNLNGE